MMRQESRDSAVIGGGAGTLACYLAGVGSKSVPLAKETQATGAGGWVWASCVVLRPCPSAPPPMAGGLRPATLCRLARK